MRSNVANQSVPSIVTDLLGQFAVLLRKEGELARTEMSEKMTQMAVALGLLVAGAVLVMPALVVLLFAAVAALDQGGMNSATAALIVGGAVLLLGLILVMVGVSRLKARRLVPRKTIHQLQEDVSVAKRQVRSDNEYERAA
jgi:membrane protein implicated in regulation of membrane protease activity